MPPPSYAKKSVELNSDAMLDDGFEPDWGSDLDVPMNDNQSAFSSAIPPSSSETKKDKVVDSHVEVDMLSTTAGGTTLYKEQEEEDAMSDDSIAGRTRVETVQSGHSKLSKSTVSSRRSAGVRSRRLEKHLAHCRAKAAESGKAVIIVDSEEHREAQRLNMIVMPPGVDLSGRPAAEVITANLRLLEEQKFTLEERMHIARQRDEYFRPKFSPKPKSKASFDKAHYNMLESRGDGRFWCRLCQKTCWGGAWAAQDQHTKCPEHAKRVEEQAAADEMCGEAKSARRFEPTCGYEGPLSEDWQLFKVFWGSNVTNMPELVWARIRAGTVLEVDMPHWGKKCKIQLTSDRVRTVEMAAVTYPGQGKYDMEKDCVVPYGKFERLIEDDGFYKMNSDGTKGWGHIPGRGWWPVCIITWDTQAEDHGYASAEVYFRDMVSGRVMCYVLCWYQLFDGTLVLSVWAVRFVSRL